MVGWLVGWLGFVGFTLAYLIYGCCVDWLVGWLVGSLVGQYLGSICFIWLVAWKIDLSASILGSKSLAQGDKGANKNDVHLKLLSGKLWISTSRTSREQVGDVGNKSHPQIDVKLKSIHEHIELPLTSCHLSFYEETQFRSKDVSL